MSNVTLVVFTDGRRDCLEQTLASASENLSGVEFSHRVMVNDSLNAEYAEWLLDTYHDFEHIRHTEKKGFCGAIQSAWRSLTPDTQYVFHLEDDFIFNRPVPLHDMIAVLDANPNLVQIALRRQAWSADEVLAGGVVEMWPEEYAGTGSNFGNWLEHRLFFTTNPSIYPVHITTAGWPDAPACEQKFTDSVLEDPDACFAYWGKRTDDPWVRHIGNVRAGEGY